MYQYLQLKLIHYENMRQTMEGLLIIFLRYFIKYCKLKFYISLNQLVLLSCYIGKNYFLLI